jgi:uncharacterized protein (TIGR00255 family)
MIHSMTGFGRAAGALSSRFFVAVTVKSVNHRFLEPSIRLPEYFWEAEPLIRNAASETFLRGKIDISIRVQRTEQPEYSVRINQQIANTVIPQLKLMADDLGLGNTFAASDLLRVPDLMQVEAVDSEIREEEREALIAILRDAFAQLTAMRRVEGEALQTDMLSRLSTIRDLLERLGENRDDIRAEIFANFKQRVTEIGAAAGVQVPEERIAQEVVMLVEKGDIAEEITRLRHHIEEFEKAVAKNEPSGKKLDFVTQEMLREINTIGSKSRSVALRTLVVELKTELERIREQVQNVE